MRRLQTGVPPPVWRSSGSRVRLPTSTTRLMLAMVSLLPGVRGTRLLRGPVGVIGGRGHGRDRRRSLGVTALDTPHGEVAHHAVGDFQDAGDLGEGLRAR